MTTKSHSSSEQNSQAQTSQRANDNEPSPFPNLSFCEGSKTGGGATNVTLPWPTFRDRYRKFLRTKETREDFNKLGLIKQLDLKSRAGWIVGGPSIDGHRSKASIVERGVLSLDIEGEDFTPAMLASLLDGTNPLCRFEWCLHTSCKHTPEAPRVRIFIPLVNAIPAADYEPLARFVAAILDPILDSVDGASFKHAQVMFKPVCLAGAKYIFHHNAGGPLDPDEFLGTWDRDYTKLPFSKKRTPPREGGQKMQDPTEKTGFVGAFSRAHPSMEEGIAEFLSDVYASTASDDRYRYIHGSGGAAAIIYDDLFLCSHHDTDPANGTHNLFDLLRIHLFGELDEGVTDLAPGSMPSFKAMVERFGEEPEIVADMAEQGEEIVEEFEKYHDHYDASYDDTIGYTEKEFRDFFRMGKAKPADDGFEQSYDDTIGYTEDEFRDFFRTGKAKPADDPLGGGTLRFHYDYELEALPADIDFVQGLLLENSTSTIIGPTGSGKSFFALDLALHLALGIPWHGRKVEKSGVVIAALEGVGGIRKRYKALRQKYDITESLPIAFAEGSFDVRKGKTTRDALITFAKVAAAKWGVPVRWIVIDTLNRGMAGGKESDSADMGAFREGMDYIRRATGANVCTIHHTGKDESRGGRGSNVLVSDVDTEITTTLHNDKTSVARLTKQKDGAKALLGAFELAVVKLGYNDHWGDEVTSCTIEWVDMPVKGEELSASEQAAYAVLRELAGTPSKGVPEDAFRTACINGRKVSAAKKEKDRGRSFTRSYRKLISKGLVEARDGLVFVVEASFDGPGEGDE